MKGGYVSGDPRWLSVRYAGECAGCGASLPKGSRAFYWPKDKRLECAQCGESSERRFVAEVQDEVFSGGWD